MNNFSLDRISKMYEEYFYTLSNVSNGNGGFYATNDTRTELDWLCRYYPTASMSSPSLDHQETSHSADVPESDSMSAESVASVSLATLDLEESPKTDASLESNTLSSNPDHHSNIAPANPV